MTAQVNPIAQLFQHLRYEDDVEKAVANSIVANKQRPDERLSRRSPSIVHCGYELALVGVTGTGVASVAIERAVFFKSPAGQVRACEPQHFTRVLQEWWKSSQVADVIQRGTRRDYEYPYHQEVR
jgi:hypothetical protein